jgi:Holliday junction resolvasome RuvABC DNA-binding subunit
MLTMAVKSEVMPSLFKKALAIEGVGVREAMAILTPFSFRAFSIPFA